MPRYSVQVSGSGWFLLDAENEDDAADQAATATRHGRVPLRVVWDYCEVESLELEDEGDG